MVVGLWECTPGMANYYSSSYYDGHDYESILIKTREGRPIKIENNKQAALNGGTNTRVHASVLNLYDSSRRQQPVVKGQESTWSALDSGVVEVLKAAEAKGQQVVVLTSTVLSPSQKALIKNFGSAYTHFRHVDSYTFAHSNKWDA